jgi:hypothetical protein
MDEKHILDEKKSMDKKTHFKKTHLFGNSNEWCRCGIPVENIGDKFVTNNVEMCTCRKCVMYMLRDSINQFLLLEER